MIDWTPNAVALQLGPISLYWYGIGYAIGLAAAYWVMVGMARRFRQNPTLIGNGLIVVAIAALAGGRVYHVIDQWHLYAADPLKIFLPPYSGLGAFGGLLTGVIAVIALARFHKVSFWRWADIVAPGVFVMQAVGRLGNFFNQELYGPPTMLPWGIAIDCEHRVPEYPCTTFPLADTHFQPLFLYESLSGLIGAVVLIWLASRPRPWLRAGDLAAIMFIWIGLVRFLIEFLRIGNWRIGDIPTAQLFSAAFVLLGVGILVVRRRQGAPQLVPESGSPEALALEEAAGADGVGEEGGSARARTDDGDEFDEFDEFDAARGASQKPPADAAEEPVREAAKRPSAGTDNPPAPRAVRKPSRQAAPKPTRRPPKET